MRGKPLNQLHVAPLSFKFARCTRRCWQDKSATGKKDQDKDKKDADKKDADKDKKDQKKDVKEVDRRYSWNFYDASTKPPKDVSGALTVLLCLSIERQLAGGHMMCMVAMKFFASLEVEPHPRKGMYYVPRYLFSKLQGSCVLKTDAAKT